MTTEPRAWPWPQHGKTYELGLHPDGHPYIRCLRPRCKRVSYHIQDIANLYCGHCQQWHDVHTEGAQPHG